MSDAPPRFRRAAAAPESVDALAALFDSEYTGLCRLVYVITGDAGVAEDIVSDAFLKVFTAWRRIHDIDRLPAYLRRTAVNLARSRTRRRRVEAHANRRVTESPATPGDALSDHDDASAIWPAVMALPYRQRAAVVLRYYADLPDREIAEALGCSESTVRSQLFKARSTLAASLGDLRRA